MSLMDEVTAQGDDALARKYAAAQAENKRLKDRVKRLTTEAAELENIVSLVEGVKASEVVPPVWLRKTSDTDPNSAVVCALLSDAHWDEVVDPAQIYGLNCYNREIATMRLQRWAEKVVELPHDYMAGVDIGGVVVMLGGDLFTGVIHQELADTNEAPILASVVYWLEQLIAALNYILDAYGFMEIDVIVGNHPRLSPKPRAKGGVRDNFDWLLGQLLKMHYVGDDRVTVNVSEAFDLLVPVLDHRHLLTHGDQARGGKGWGGMFSPINRMHSKKKEIRQQEPYQFDTLVMGHFHQSFPTSKLVVGGALKGYDEYASRENFVPEPAQQALWVVTPENGISWMISLLCEDRRAEGW